MEEINVQKNETEMKVFINGIPDLSLMPKEIAEMIISKLEVKISEKKEIENTIANRIVLQEKG